MNQKKMQVLYIEQTGHILAAFTQVAASDLQFDIKSLAGSALLVRSLAKHSLSDQSGGEILFVPTDLLKPEIVDLNESAFVMPFNFMVGGGQVNDLRITESPSFEEEYFSPYSIKISVEAVVTEETKVWAQVEEKKDPLTDSEPIRRIVTGIIKPEDSPVPGGISDGRSVMLDLRTRPDEQPAPIPKGTYFILGLVAGRRPLFLTAALK